MKGMGGCGWAKRRLWPVSPSRLWGDQAFAVHEPEAGAGLVGAESFFLEGGVEELGDAGGGGTRAEEEHAQVLERDAGDAGGGVDPGQGHGGGALDVVVETAHAVPVLFQECVGVGGGKILELDQGLGEA
jgi:hypothetical protein